MKTKREVLKVIAKKSTCEGITCINCPYENAKRCPITATIKRIGATAILRMFKEAKREFDPNKVLTCVTADQAKVGMKGYFADDLARLKTSFNNRNVPHELTNIYGEGYIYRFGNKISDYNLFYPIDEFEVE